MVALGRYLMGTRFEIVLDDEDDPARLRAAGEEALDEIERIEGQLSLYREDSAIAAVNAHAANEWVRVPGEVFRLLEEALALGRRTGRAFDITLLPLLRAWGFIGGSGRPTDEADALAARALTGPDNVLLDPDTTSVRFRRPGMGIDLGAVGKGYALDCAASLLRDLGVANALIHGGTSTVIGLGQPAGGGAWQIAIRDTRDAESSVATVALSEARALSVSAGHGKSFIDEAGRARGHVLDPRTGSPAESADLAAVVTAGAARADALSTALLVLGAEGMSLLAEVEPGSSGLVINGSDILRAGPAFLAAPGAP